MGSVNSNYENAGMKNYQIDTKKLFAELKREDKGKDIDEARQEICWEVDRYFGFVNKQVAYAICNNKPYEKDNPYVYNVPYVLSDRRNKDWHAILMLFAHGVFDPDKIFQLLPPDSEAKEEGYTSDYFITMLANVWEYYKSLKQIGKVRAKIRTIRSLVADTIIKKYTIKTFVDPQTNGIIGVYKWTKEKGVYEPFDYALEAVLYDEEASFRVLDTMTTAVPHYIPFYVNRHVFRIIYKKIQDESKVLLSSPPLRVAFSNATIDWTGKRIRFIRVEDRTPDDYAFNYIPRAIHINDITAFLEKEKEISIEKIEEFARVHCPKSLAVFKQWVGDKWVLLYELIGYTLYPSNEFRKGFLLVGPYNTGKTTFGRLVTSLVDEPNVSNLRLCHIFSPKWKYAREWLFLKLANLASQTIEYKPNYSDNYKKLFGEDYIIAYRKYRGAFMFKSYAKPIFESNTLPLGWDKADEDFKSRWVIIEFKTRFKTDTTWYDQTFTEEEKNGILSTAIIAMARVLQKNQFDFDQRALRV